jgi:hypothetical protein
MYYSYVGIECIATSFSPARMDLALKLLKVNADKFYILRTSTEYLEVLTSKRPQSNKA